MNRESATSLEVVFTLVVYCSWARGWTGLLWDGVCHCPGRCIPVPDSQ